MADTLADVVENMDLEEGASNGSAGTKSEGDADKDAGAGARDTGDRSGESGNKSGDKDAAKDGPAGNDEGASGTKDAGDEDADTGYVADEVGEDDEVVETKDPKVEATPSNLSPDLQYIVDRLPVLSVRGKDGKNYQVKAAGQLPDTFEFATKKDELIFSQSLAAQELKAQQLQAEYQGKQQADQAAKYNTQENEDIRSDMGDLQREGLLGKFQHSPTDKGFTDDPAVKQAQEVMDYMNKKNEAYTKAGRLYRISFRDAFEQLAAQGKTATSEADQAQAKEDAERKGVARRTAGGRTTSAGKTIPARPARSFEDLFARIDNMEI